MLCRFCIELQFALHFVAFMALLSSPILINPPVSFIRLTVIHACWLQLRVKTDAGWHWCMRLTLRCIMSSIFIFYVLDACEGSQHIITPTKYFGNLHQVFALVFNGYVESMSDGISTEVQQIWRVKSKRPITPGLVASELSS